MLGEVERSIFLGEYFDVRIRIGAETVRARLGPYFEVKDGDKLYVKITGNSCSVMRSESMASV